MREEIKQRLPDRAYRAGLTVEEAARILGVLGCALDPIDVAKSECAGCGEPQWEEDCTVEDLQYEPHLTDEDAYKVVVRAYSGHDNVELTLVELILDRLGYALP